MSAEAIAAELGISEQQALEMFAIYICCHELNERMSFEKAVADKSIRICLKNAAHARGQALARRRTKSANDASQFQLTP